MFNSMITFDKIKDFFKQGWTYKRIGNQFGVSRQRIQQVVKENGYGNRRPPVPDFTDEKKFKQSEFYRKRVKQFGRFNLRDYLNRQPVSKKKRLEVFQRDNFTCQYCGKKRGEVKLSVTHKIPLSRDNRDNFHDIENLITACRSCSSKKGYRTHEEFVSNKKVTMFEALGK